MLRESSRFPCLGFWDGNSQRSEYCKEKYPEPMGKWLVPVPS